MTNQNKPVLTLNMNEKIYLAVAKHVSEPLSYVYTLACLKYKDTSNYDLIATPEIHTFENKKSAGIYHDTIEQIIVMNSSDETKIPMFQANEKIIQNFMQNVR